MDDLIAAANAARLAGAADGDAEARLGAGARLFAYGTLRPGEPNHHVVAGIAGRWLPGTVAGTVWTCPAGSHAGLPALTLGAGLAEGMVLLSPALPAHWPRLDAFEGALYARLLARVETPEGPFAANVYEFRG
mgnify:CR=1 FL=1